MFTKITTSEELKAIISEGFFNKTDKVTKIADNSVLNGYFYGLSKVAQKALKEIALLESHILPESAFGEQLDIIAERNGIGSRFGATKSSTYIRVVGNPGTIYNQTLCTCTSKEGIEFELQETVTLGPLGYAYIKVRSIDSGLRCNVNALSIKTISPIPNGHQYLINEYQATGGRDIESDQELLKRIKEGPNILAQDTLAKITQNLIKINPNVLRCVYQGTNGYGKTIISVISVNGMNFSQNELNDFNSKVHTFFSLVDLRSYEYKTTGVIFQNVVWYPLDISMRVKLDPAINPDLIRKEIQIKLSKLYDPRTWESGRKYEWDDCFLSCKNSNGIIYIADQYFFPKTDIILPKNTFPRLRGFQLLNLDGSIITDVQGNLNPLYYPNKVDFNYQKSVINTLN